MARHRLADLFLDTFPVNAHTTASDALWAGCPVLTIAGRDVCVPRVAGSLLRSLGLPELVTTSLADYEATALRLAADAELLGQLRARLEANRKTSTLFDAGRFARNLEKAYSTMWETYAAGEKPRAFAVKRYIKPSRFRDVCGNAFRGIAVQPNRGIPRSRKSTEGDFRQAGR